MNLINIKATTSNVAGVIPQRAGLYLPNDHQSLSQLHVVHNQRKSWESDRNYKHFKFFPVVLFQHSRAFLLNTMRWLIFLKMDAQKQCLSEDKHRHLLFTLCYFPLCPVAACATVSRVFKAKYDRFVLSLFRVSLVLVDWKVRVETMVLRWVRHDDWAHRSITSDWRPNSRLPVLLFIRWSSSLQGPRGVQGPQGQLGKPGKRVSELSDLVHSHCAVWVCSHASVFIAVWVFVLVATAQMLRSLLPVRQTMLDMRLKACAAFNPRINGRALNLSENARVGKPALDVGTASVTLQSVFRAKCLDLIGY